MSKIDLSKPVLVTGANVVLGLVKQLLMTKVLRACIQITKKK